MTRHASSGVRCIVRPAVAADAEAVTALVIRETSGSGYASGPRYFVQRAFLSPDEETRCLVAEREEGLVGCVLFGPVAGTVGTARLNFIAVADGERRRGVGTMLCDGAFAVLASEGAQRVVVELPDDAAFGPAQALLSACGFAEVARVPHFYREKVGLLIVERRAAGT